MDQKLAKIRKILVALILIASVAGFISCDKYSYPLPVVDPDVTVLFQDEIQPIFNSKCIDCHNGTQYPNLTDGKSYEALSKGGLITPPGETSGLYLKMTGSSHILRSSDIEKQTVLNWINQGALNN
jgi:hypothetical protein